MSEQPEKDFLSLEEALALALRLHQSGHLAEAEAGYQAILQAAPGLPDALHFLGVLRYQQMRPEEAITLIRQALAGAPDYADAHNNLGNIFKELRRLDEARAAYQRVIELAPHHAGAHNNLGVLARYVGDTEQALDYYRRAMELAPEAADAPFNLGNVYVELDRYEDAVHAYREALRLDSRHLFAYKQLGLTLYRLGRLQEAETVYRDWLALSPDHPVALHMLAACSGEAVPQRAADNYVRTLFDQFAESFDTHLADLDYRAPALLAQAVAARLGEPRDDLLVLDAGCGTGLCGPLLRPYARHLIGVDLSAGMLARARRKNCFDVLEEAELTAYLQTRQADLDLIVSADTVVYFGDLQALLAAAAGALKPGGWLLFTVERDDDDPTAHRLDFSGRYRHGEKYLRTVLTAAGFGELELRPVVPRTEAGEPVAGLLVGARRISP